MLRVTVLVSSTRRKAPICTGAAAKAARDVKLTAKGTVKAAAMLPCVMMSVCAAATDARR